MRGRLVVIAAPSGTGKTSLSRALIERLRARGLKAVFSVSYTTRAARPGEIDGRDYHFLSDAAFREMISRDEFLEHALVFDRRYGTGKRVTDALLREGAHVFLDIDWQGARQVRARAPQDCVSIFLLPPSLEELERRLRSRGQDDDAAIARRMQAARDEISHSGEFQHVLVNDDFDRTLATLEKLLAPA